MVSLTGNKYALQSIFDDPGGEYKTIRTPDPAAGAEVAYQVPAGTSFQLLCANFFLVTDATVANRFVALNINDDAAAGGDVIAAIQSGVAITASLGVRVTFGIGLSGSTAIAGSALQTALPDQLLLPAGYRIATATQGLVAGDNHSFGVLYGIEYRF
jgi:hypothetical protein